MQRNIQRSPVLKPVLRKSAAAVILVAVSALIIHVVLGLVMAVFWVAVVLAAVVAAIWALKTLVW